MRNGFGRNQTPSWSLKATVFDNRLFLGEYLLFMQHSWMD